MKNINKTYNFFGITLTYNRIASKVANNEIRHVATFQFHWTKNER